MPSLLLFLLVILVGASRGYSQTNDNLVESHGTHVVLSGIVIVSDWRCEGRRDEVDLPFELERFCTEERSDWGFVSGHDLYLLHGDAASFKKYERHRVTIAGLATGNKITVDSIVPASVADGEIRHLIEELRSHPWSGPKNYTVPMQWVFDFTEPMLKILEAGSTAQDILMTYLDDQKIRDQIIILLGGVGDEKVVESIIREMPTPAQTYGSADAKRTTLTANIALTNITVSEVIWHHGGGIPVNACPDDPKFCWQAWWIQNRDTFRVSAGTPSRRYSNYPSYGIYQQP
jgi:hypothetical protein